MRKLYLALALGLATLAATGCGGGNPTNYAGPIPTICPDLALAPPSLIYPIDGATGVPDGNFPLVIFNNGYTLSEISNVALTFSTGSIPLTFGAPPNPVPTPAVTPLPATTSMFGAAVPALTQATQYTLLLTTTTTGACGSTSHNIVGSFTTQ